MSVIIPRLGDKRVYSLSGSNILSRRAWFFLTAVSFFACTVQGQALTVTIEKGEQKLTVQTTSSSLIDAVVGGSMAFNEETVSQLTNLQQISLNSKATVVGGASGTVVVYYLSDDKLVKCTEIPVVSGSCDLPETISCLSGKTIKEKVFLQLKLNGNQYAELFVPESRTIIEVPEGSEYGFSATVIDQWGNQMGANLNGAVGAYYAFDSGKNPFKIVTNINILDLDSDKDFEMGIGLGFMYRPKAVKPGSIGFALAAGVGYNLMIDNHDDRYYTFLGLSLNPKSLK